jgi:hypothetical protein
VGHGPATQIELPGAGVYSQVLPRNKSHPLVKAMFAIAIQPPYALYVVLALTWEFDSQER